MDWLLTIQRYNRVQQNNESSVRQCLFECLGFEKKDNPSQWMKKTELLFLIRHLWFLITFFNKIQNMRCDRFVGVF